MKKSKKKNTVVSRRKRVKRNHKDNVFRMLFSDENMLLMLYNAINDTNYADTSLLKITTLENAVYMSVKNDVSCMVDMRLELYEHQSTVNPNMPLRDLDYIADTFANFYSDKDIYSSNPIELPNPRFIVFYNGEQNQPAIKTYKLSDLYVHKGEEPNLELIVTQININAGYNKDLMEKCQVLKEYMLYVERVRKYQKAMPIEQAVNRAVDECIEEGILADFLRKNKAEVVRMSIYEYDEKLHAQALLEDGIKIGKEEGILGAVSIMSGINFSDEIIKSKLMETYNLSEVKALEYIKKVRDN
ncbi:MAG: hypothetical protein E7263_08645 [Lachnospiraceae bacterium]|nr:hypothetical protein [Lachnospiraceae bacterium]